MFVRTILGATLAVGLVSSATLAQDAEPWVVPLDAGMALREPDAYAWRLFVAITWPADIDARAADPTAAYGAEGPVVFETWARSDQTYLANGAQPPAWADIPFEGTPAIDENDGVRQLDLIRQTAPVPPGTNDHRYEQVRMNEAAFTYIRNNGLYSIEGQQRYFYDNLVVEFPIESMEVKALWRPIGEEDKPRYHWMEVADAATGEVFIYGLASMHMTSKVLPQWHWSTFEHIDNRYLTGTPDEGWLNPSRDAAACPADNLDCNAIPTGFGLEGTVWENYRLRGSQISFVDDYGAPIILGNSQLETGFQQTASCMSCHTRATIGPNRNDAASFAFGPDSDAHPPAAPQAMRLSVFAPNSADGQVLGYVGTPDASWFVLPGQVSANRMFTRLDFVFSLLEAQSEGIGADDQ